MIRINCPACMNETSISSDDHTCDTCGQTVPQDHLENRVAGVNVPVEPTEREAGR